MNAAQQNDDATPWTHRPVALTVLCALVAAGAVLIGYAAIDRAESAIAGSEADGDPQRGLLVGIVTGVAGRRIEMPAPETLLRVHVAGHVVSDGLVVLPAESRVVDAITAAGGATERADLSQVNLAQPLSDGDQVLVPTFGEP